MSEFENIKVGDEVYIPGQYGLGGALAIVSKVTPATFTAGSRTFNKQNGWQRGRGRSYSRTWASMPTPEIRAKCLREGMVRKLEKAKFRELTDRQLAALCQILDEPQESK